MLAYLDRFPAELPTPPRVALLAMRVWAADLRRGRCPIALLQALFEGEGAPSALWPAHNFLYWAGAHAARSIDLGCPCCGKVSDDEALLLSAMFAQDITAALAAMQELLEPEAHIGGVRLARALGDELNALEARTV